MKNKKGFIQIPLLIAIIAGVLVLGGGYFGIRQWQNYQTEKAGREKVAQEIQKQKDLEVEKLKQEVEDLKNKKPEIIQQTIVKEVPAQTTGSDLPSIIKQWRPKIAKVECFWYTSSGSLYGDAWGSGLLINQTKALASRQYVIFTNRHVVDDQTYGGGADACRITFPGTTENYDISTHGNDAPIKIGLPSGFDFAVIWLASPGPYVQSNALAIVDYNSNTSTFNLCKDRASAGDSVIILGYPGIGAQGDITATDGIISGYDGNYYITSAKVEHGNSGGAAILLKDNCYLGIPTWAKTGSVESLARILGVDYVISEIFKP